MKYGLLFVFFIFNKAVAQHVPKINFVPKDTSFEKAATEYREIWKTEGEKIIHSLEKCSGMQLSDTFIIANILNAPSNSGWKQKPMTLRSSYSYQVKKGTLIHELAHRLHASLIKYPETIKNDHELLFLYLYDVFTDLYGIDFANQMVRIEGERSNSRNNYKKMWDDVLLLSRKEREQKLKSLIDKQ